MNEHYDILIVGGGLVGASLGVALAESRYRVGLLEARPVDLHAPAEPNYDDRTLALSLGSRRIFDGLRLWNAVTGEAAAIETIHVSERGRFGATRLYHHEENVEALGYVVPMRVLGQALYQRLSTQENLDIAAPARLESLAAEDETIKARIDAGKTIECRLLVAADGVESQVRSQFGIGARREDYGQTAIIANVTPQRAHRHVAYECFTDSGPLALLPLTDGPGGERRCALVWTHRSEETQATMALNDAAFLRALQARFGWRLGRFLKVGRRQVFPLALVSAERHTCGRVALLGNAAHTLHPVAGQGFNLALRDAARLAELLTASEVRDPGDPVLLNDYAQGQQRDFGRVLRFTDSLARLFSNPWPPLRLARGASLLALDLLPPLRHWIAHQSMGLAGRLPRLACGMTLTGDRVNRRSSRNGNERRR